ncbi:large ribosomal subunit protein bL27m isoform X1 [Brachyistius frenatus]|uniref:large ribosomal subunit protein bL27m isoform X1 n=1 Tax=Brachyistius frenatus TaxID=100188 RepID=UPI0037E7AB04
MEHTYPDVTYGIRRSDIWFMMAALASLMLKPRAGMKRVPQSSLLVSGLLTPAQSSLLVSLRFASKKAGGSSKNVGGKSPGRRYGFKKQDGNFVHAGNILATQRLMRYHPGAHVGMGTNNTLFALEDGYVRFTKEVYVPPPRSPEATRVITKLPKGALLFKTFINVLPVKQEGKFRLVDSV